MESLVQVFKALADESRFRILELLLESDLCGGALARQLDISKSAVSQHLKVLREAGLVRGERRGYYTHYVVDTDVLRMVAAELVERADTPRKACLSMTGCELPDKRDKHGT